MEQDCAASTAGASGSDRGDSASAGGGTAGSATAKYAAALKVPTVDAMRALRPFCPPPPAP